MEDLERAMLARVPLAEGVLWLWRHVLDEAALQEVWDENRGRCYDRVITFPMLVMLVHDALLRYASARESFLKHAEAETFAASLQAAYGKLSRVPVPVSQAFLLQSYRRLRELFPGWACWQKPESLRRFGIVIYDGKAIKRVAKRLKPCRGAAGGLLGGRALVAMDWETGMAVAMRGDVDGDANDVKHVGELAPIVRAQFDGPLLSVSDAGFCDLEQPRHFTRCAGDHFLVRHHPKVHFHRDETIPARTGVNDLGQPFVETWGWLGSAKDRRRLAVRHIELTCDSAQPVILITDLLDADEFPATDLLWIYRERWEIERLFQKVTEVFGLSHLIGCSPEATLFQFALCLVLYNTVQTVRGHIAQAQDLEPSAVSTEMLFRDVARELTALNVMINTEQVVDHFTELPETPALHARLATLFARCGSDTWTATAPQRPRNITPKETSRTHNSVYRLVQKSQTTPNKNSPQRC